MPDIDEDVGDWEAGGDVQHGDGKVEGDAGLALSDVGANELIVQPVGAFGQLRGEDAAGGSGGGAGGGGRGREGLTPGDGEEG